MEIVVVACRSADVEEKSGGGGNGAVCHAVSDSLPSGIVETATGGEGRQRRMRITAGLEQGKGDERFQNFRCSTID
jgi:hypothetical protein